MKASLRLLCFSYKTSQNALYLLMCLMMRLSSSILCFRLAKKFCGWTGLTEIWKLWNRCEKMHWCVFFAPLSGQTIERFANLLYPYIFLTFPRCCTLCDRACTGNMLAASESSVSLEEGPASSQWTHGMLEHYCTLVLLEVLSCISLKFPFHTIYKTFELCFFQRLHVNSPDSKRTYL